MAASVNKVIILGNLGQDPEVRYLQNGTPVCTFTVATHESWNKGDSGEKGERTEWHRVVAWRRMAELCGEYLAKGRQVYVEGKLQTRQWEDKDGQKRYTTEVVAREVQFLGSRDGAGAPRAAGAGGFDRPAGAGGFDRPAAGAPASGGRAPAPAGDQGGSGGGFDYGPPPMGDDDIPF